MKYIKFNHNLMTRELYPSQLHSMKKSNFQSIAWRLWQRIWAERNFRKIHHKILTFFHNLLLCMCQIIPHSKHIIPNSKHITPHCKHIILHPNANLTCRIFLEVKFGDNIVRKNFHFSSRALSTMSAAILSPGWRFCKQNIVIY